MSDERMFELAEKLRRLRDDKAAADQRLKDINREIDETAYELSELMAQTETQNFTRGGMMFYLKSTTRASAVAGSKDELYSALKNQGFGDLVYETVNANSLSSFVREQMEDNAEALPGWLDGLVNLYEQTTVGLRKAK